MSACWLAGVWLCDGGVVVVVIVGRGSGFIAAKKSCGWRRRLMCFGNGQQMTARVMYDQLDNSRPGPDTGAFLAEKLRRG